MFRSATALPPIQLVSKGISRGVTRASAVALETGLSFGTLRGLHPTTHVMLVSLKLVLTERLRFVHCRDIRGDTRTKGVCGTSPSRNH